MRRCRPDKLNWRLAWAMLCCLLALLGNFLRWVPASLASLPSNPFVTILGFSLPTRFLMNHYWQEKALYMKRLTINLTLLFLVLILKSVPKWWIWKKTLAGSIYSSMNELKITLTRGKRGESAKEGSLHFPNLSFSVSWPLHTDQEKKWEVGVESEAQRFLKRRIMLISRVRRTRSWVHPYMSLTTDQ